MINFVKKNGVRIISSLIVGILLIPVASYSAPSISVDGWTSLYHPDDPVTREWMAVFIVTAKEGEPPADYCSSGSPFTDVPPTNVFCKYIKRLPELNISGGCAAGMYCPGNNVLRDQMAAFIIRGVEGNPPLDYCASGSPFTDITVVHWACGYIKRLSELNITQGCDEFSPSNMFCPSNPTTRAQMAAMTIRAFRNPNSPYSPTPYFSDVPASHPFFSYIQLIMDEQILPIDFFPAGFDFGQGSIGSPVLHSFAIRNTGDAPLDIGNISFTGNDVSDFQKLNDTCSMQTIPPSGNCIVDMAFAPTIPGVKNADMNIPSNDPGTPILKISLSGTLEAHTIDATAGQGGSIIPSGPVVVSHGGNQIFTITPDQGYYILDVKVDGTSQGPIPSYTFANVTANHSIEATFTIHIYSISGFVRLSASGLEGVLMNGLPGGPLTDSNGFYSATVPYGWSGTVEPIKFGYSFQPAQKAYNSVTNNQSNQDYTANLVPLLNIGTGNGRRGDSVSLPVILTNVAGTTVSAISIDIGYNKTILENPTAVIGPAGSAADKILITGNFGPVWRVSIFSVSNNTPIGDGVVAYITFNINTGSPLGPAIITNTPSASNPAGGSVNINGLNGSVNVTAYAAGDCDTNGSVDIAEVQSAVNMFLAINPVGGCVDTNNDSTASIGEIQKVINNHFGISGIAMEINDLNPANVAAAIANASGNVPSVKLGMITSTPGTTVTVPLTLVNVPGYEVAAISTDITYDMTRLENPVVELGPVGSTAGKTIVFREISPGTLRIGLFSMANNTVIGNGVISNINFHIRADAQEGAAILGNTSLCSDKFGYDLPTEDMNGVINVNVQNFVDIPGTNWARDYIYTIFNFDITLGCSAAPLQYCPDNPVTREQMAAFIVRAVFGEPPIDYCGLDSPFADVPAGSGFCKYIKKLLELNITQGCGVGLYCPSGIVTREQMAAFLVRAKVGEPALNLCDTGSPFTDVSPSSGFCRYVKKLLELNVTQGCAAGMYCPSNDVLRDQMAAFLARAFLGMP
ncbi:MAG: hypothetical protein A2V86_03660 [Deltaproteobacteria bacterium RBG_16_49_23]|nr:MAG: hypothetical protein A2V86_03660 [Deltaproteobacteria bacterium RBG_16_49_23]